MSFWAYRTMRGAGGYPRRQDVRRVQVLRYETRADRDLACASGTGIRLLSSQTARALLMNAARGMIADGTLPRALSREVAYMSNDDLWHEYVANSPYL